MSDIFGNPDAQVQPLTSAAMDLVIETDAAGAVTGVLLDGQRLRLVQGFEYKLDVGGLGIATIRLIARLTTRGLLSDFKPPVLPPLPQTPPVTPEQLAAEAEQMAEAWKANFGDPDDPVVRARIDRTASQLCKPPSSGAP